jgi:hypothetical protein
MSEKRRPDKIIVAEKQGKTKWIRNRMNVQRKTMGRCSRQSPWDCQIQNTNEREVGHTAAILDDFRDNGSDTKMAFEVNADAHYRSYFLGVVQWSQKQSMKK